MPENKQLEFPAVSDVDVAFGGYPKDWFDETLKREFQSKENGRKYENIVNGLFFDGGAIPTSDTVPAERRKAGLRIFKAIIGSFKPKHEHKTKVCALILEALNENVSTAEQPAQEDAAG